MEALINNFRMSRHRQTTNHIILTLPKVGNKEQAKKLIGKKIVFKTKTGREIKGEIKSSHGNKGAVRAIFERGLPGQAIGTKIKVE